MHFLYLLSIAIAEPPYFSRVRRCQFRVIPIAKSFDCIVTRKLNFIVLIRLSRKPNRNVMRLGCHVWDELLPRADLASYPA